MRRILHPSDFSLASRAAFKKAVELAKASRAELLVVHVLPPLPLILDVYIAARTYNELQRAHRATGRKQLDRLLAKAKTAGVRVSGLLLDWGIPSQQIVGAAKAKRIDMIVMGTHGRGALGKAFLGSVATRVVATAPCAVLTVRGK